MSNDQVLEALTECRAQLKAAVEPMESTEWAPVDAWASEWRSWIRRLFPSELEDFDRLVARPPFSSAWPALHFDRSSYRYSREAEARALQSHQDSVARHARSNKSLAVEKKQSLLRFLDGIERLHGIPTPDQAADPTLELKQMESGMKVFISHSSADRDAAAAFVELLRTALLIPAKEIRCTSVDGYKLAGGTNANDQLRQEVFDAETFVALLSPSSMASVYVMFELGARWGANRHLVPLMIGGVKPSDLKAPLSAIHAVSSASEGDMYQLVDTLAGQLSLSAETPNVYMKALKLFVEAAKPRP